MFFDYVTFRHATLLNNPTMLPALIYGVCTLEESSFICMVNSCIIVAHKWIII